MDHKVTTEPVKRLGGSRAYVGRCTCGWRGKMFDQEIDAQWEASEHELTVPLDTETGDD